MSSRISSGRQQPFQPGMARLKWVLRVRSDKQVYEALGMKQVTFAHRRARNSFPAKAVRALAERHPEVAAFLDYILASDGQLSDMRSTHHPTPGDIARDNTTFAVATAYSRLLSPTRADLVAFLAGPRNPVEAHRVAENVVASTADADLVPLLARLLMGADSDEAVEAAAYGIGAVSGFGTDNTQHPLRRSYDKAEG